MDNKEIREEFKVESGRRAYRDFIERLRSLLAGRRMVRNCPVLPSLAQVPSNYPQFEIVLRANNPVNTDETHAITLRFRRQDIYLEAYRMENSDTWLEFSTPDQSGPQFLGFDGGYVGSHGLEAAAGRGRDRIRLGRDDLRDAVNNLATSFDRQERARSLLVVIQMTAESIRFEDIEYFILLNYIEGRGDVPDHRILELENSWGSLSNALLRSDAHPDLSIFPIRYIHEGIQHLFTLEQAIAAIGLLLFNVKGIPRTRFPRAADDQGEGRPLVEVFGVIINDIDAESPGDLYGTIKVTDGLVSQYIFNRERGDIESIYPGENATLTGPAAASISALDDFIIDVALMDRDSFPDPSPDDEISKGQIVWNVYHTSTNAYDVPLSQKISGNHGSSNVVYTVLSNAAQANVEVTLINGDNEDPADVYGTIAASNSIGNFANYESVLFRKKSGDYIDVRPRELIPLSRSIVAVPLNSDLIVRADLYDHDSFPDLSPDDEIAKGTANFSAQLSGSTEKTISGQSGSIRVKVSWTP